jgi:hypothetical protein
MPRDRHTLLSVNVTDLETNNEATGGSSSAAGLSAVAGDLRVLLQLHACQQVHTSYASFSVPHDLAPQSLSMQSKLA